MIFSSIPFLYYFLPCVLILYFIAPYKLKNFVLLLASLLFYAWGEPKYVILMAISIGIGYISGLLIEANRGRSLSRYIMLVSVALCLSFLGYFKYAGFIADNLKISIKDIALPVGISFYTFQIISYIIDVYRGEKSQKNPISLSCYVTMFPQLIAGPIVRYVDIAKELSCRKHNFENIAAGIRRFMIGLAKKIFLANVLGEFCDVFRNSNDKSVLFFWVYAIAYVLQVYFDFSGYSDMAMGLGRIFGFNFLENFNYPLISKSITEFWRRWHMSLGTWFRDYVYIPLGGNRKGKLRWFFNLFVVWMLTGLWHGAAWNFVVWGLMFGVILMIEKAGLKSILDRFPIINRVYVIIILLISFVIFGAANMGEAGTYIGSMFGAGSYPMISAEFIYYARSYAFVLIIGLIAATPLIKNIYERLASNKTLSKVFVIMEPALLIGGLLVVTAYLVDGSYNPFLYFRF